MDKSNKSLVPSIVKGKSGAMKNSDAWGNTSDEYPKKLKVKKVHFSDVIEVCVETVYCSRTIDDDDESELSNLFEVPLNQRSMMKIQLHQTADNLNADETFNALNNRTVLRQCHQRLQMRKSFRDFIGSQDFTAPLATMEEIDLFCDESPDSSSYKTDNLYFMAESSVSVEDRQPLTFAGTLDYKDHLNNEIVKCLSTPVVSETIKFSDALNHCNELQLSKTDDKICTVIGETKVENFNKTTPELPLVSMDVMPNYTAVGAFSMMENKSNSLVTNIPAEGTVEAVPEILANDSDAVPVADREFLSTDELTIQPETQLPMNDEMVSSSAVFSETQKASLPKELALSTSSSITVEAPRSDEAETEASRKEEALPEKQQPFVDCPSISNPLSMSDDKIGLLEDFVMIDEVIFDSDDIQNDFVIVDEVPGISDYVLIDRVKTVNTSRSDLISDAVEKLQSAQLTEKSNSTGETMVPNMFVAEETRPPRHGLEQSLLPGSEALVPQVSLVNGEKCEVLECIIRNEISEFKRIVEVELLHCEACVHESKVSSNGIENSESGYNGRPHVTISDANILCNSEVPLHTCGHGRPTCLSNEADSTVKHASETLLFESSFSIEKHFKCILIPNLVWLFQCNLLQWDADHQDSLHKKEGSVNYERDTRYIKPVKRQFNYHNAQLQKAKKGLRLQEHR